jgi:hypothetical protein
MLPSCDISGSSEVWREKSALLQQRVANASFRDNSSAEDSISLHPLARAKRQRLCHRTRAGSETTKEGMIAIAVVRDERDQSFTGLVCD